MFKLLATASSMTLLLAACASAPGSDAPPAIQPAETERKLPPPPAEAMVPRVANFLQRYRELWQEEPASQPKPTR